MSTGVRQYLVCVRNLEIQKETLAKTILGIDRATKKLGLPGRITRGNNPIRLDFWGDNAGCLVPLFVPVFIGVILIFNSIWGGLIPLLIGGGLIAVIIGGYKSEENKYWENEYELDRCYEADKDNDKKRVSRELALKDKYQQARDQLYATYCQTDRTLKALYAKNIIYSKYQNDLVAICMFCEYFESGRCTTLTGHEGAYNIYEQELRMGIIIGKLDVIIQKLDEIQSNQYALYTAVKQISNQQNQILDNLKQISSNQDMQSAQLEHIRYNTAALKQNSDIAMIYALF